MRMRCLVCFGIERAAAGIIERGRNGSRGETEMIRNRIEGDLAFRFVRAAFSRVSRCE
jgi:hypothetical protein